jgi:hypothetical protein
MDDREEANRIAADHIARLRKAIEDGRAEIERQRASISDTREHLTGRWRYPDERQRSDD